MKEPSRFAGAAVGMLVALAVFQIPVMAEDEGWKDVAELSLVTTSGNSEATSLGFRNTLSKAWGDSLFAFNAGGVRIENTTFTRTAASSTTFTETEESKTTADNYYLNGRFDRKLSEKMFWYAGAGWDRIRFGGVKNRYTGGGGIGHVWFDTDDRKFRTDYGLTFTDEENYDGFSDSFAGLRLGWDYLNKVGKNAVYTNTLILDENLDETSDWRANMINALSVSMSERMALKLGLQWLYDAEPAFELLPFNDPVTMEDDPDPLAEFDDLDQIFTASLVINF